MGLILTDGWVMGGDDGKPLKLTSLAHSVPKPLKVPSLARFVSQQRKRKRRKEKEENEKERKT